MAHARCPECTLNLRSDVNRIKKKIVKVFFGTLGSDHLKDQDVLFRGHQSQLDTTGLRVKDVAQGCRRVHV